MIRNKSLGFSDFILSGILFTLLGIAFGLGRLIQKFELNVEDHEKRITKIEDRIF